LHGSTDFNFDLVWVKERTHTMKKTLLALFVLIVLTTAVRTATAQDEIALGGTSANSLTFTSTGSGGWTLLFTPNPLDGPGATATGELGWSAISGYYAITQSGTISGTLISSFGGGGTWNITQSAPLGFSICSARCGSAGSTVLLTGNLQLVNLQQDGGAGVTNYSVTPTSDLLITGGTMASVVGGVGKNLILSLTLDLSKDLATYSGTSTGRVSSGEITSEPVSMALLGTGLVALGAFVRRRRAA
jgi:hypothetical protein